MQRRKKRRFHIKIILLIVVVGAVIVGVSTVKSSMFKQKEGTVSTISQSALQDVLEISELSTVEYTYNAVASAYKEDGKTLMYRVAYDGKVKAGIDFSKVKIKIDEEKKTIHIKIPEVTIQDYIVDEGSLEYIFEKDKYNKATVSAEAYKLCKADLKKKAGKESELKSLARENAISTVSGLIEPWVKQIDDEYVVNID